MQVKMFLCKFDGQARLEDEVNAWLEENSEKIDMMYTNQSMNSEGVLISIFYEIIPESPVCVSERNTGLQ